MNSSEGPAVLEMIFEALEKIRGTGLLVVVEGIKDKRALENFGIENVFCLKGPLYAMVEDIALRAKEVVLLTDLDKEGKKLYHSLFTGLQRLGVKINNNLRDLLFRTELRQIEGLARYLSLTTISTPH